MQRVRLAVLTILVAACSGEATAPAPEQSASRIGPGSVLRVPTAGTYVLTKVESQTASPFVLFDHVCRGTRTQQLLMGDTIVLSADGSSRRSFSLAQAFDGILQPGDATSWSGTWNTVNTANWYYFSGAPSISMFGAIKGVAVGGYYRVDSPTTLSTLGGVGGSCAKDGSDPSDGHEVVMVYTRTGVP